MGFVILILCEKRPKGSKNKRQMPKISLILSCVIFILSVYKQCNELNETTLYAVNTIKDASSLKYSETMPRY
jgi:uncharacterized membrane protein YiaA